MYLDTEVAHHADTERLVPREVCDGQYLGIRLARRDIGQTLHV